jgi:hypothetical protein
VFGDLAVEVKHMAILEVIENVASLFAITYKAHGSQHPKLVRHSGFRHFDRGCQIANTQLLNCQSRKDAEPIGVPQETKKLRHPLGLIGFENVVVKLADIG